MDAWSRAAWRPHSQDLYEAHRALLHNDGLIHVWEAPINCVFEMLVLSQSRRTGPFDVGVGPPSSATSADTRWVCLPLAGFSWIVGMHANHMWQPLIIVIDDHELWSLVSMSDRVHSQSTIIMYSVRIWTSNMKITFNHHIQRSSYTVITCACRNRWRFATIYHDCIRASFMTIVSGYLMRLSHVMVTSDNQIWRCKLNSVYAGHARASNVGTRCGCHTYDYHHIWSRHAVITHGIWWPYVIAMCDYQLRPLCMGTACDHHIWRSYLMTFMISIYGYPRCWLPTMIEGSHHLLQQPEGLPLQLHRPGPRPGGVETHPWRCRNTAFCPEGGQPYVQRCYGMG